jgi:hypothetical protein
MFCINYYAGTAIKWGENLGGLDTKSIEDIQMQQGHIQIPTCVLNRGHAYNKTEHWTDISKVITKGRILDSYESLPIYK